MGQPTVKISWS